MFKTRFGAFDGGSWEQLLQQVLKRKFEDEDYQPFPASPGDFGLEGVALKKGDGFQCYCPNKHYTRSELYDKQRDKITEDLGKLRKYEAEIKKLIGSTVLKRWIFITPEFDKNALIAHARQKEGDVRGWKLPFIADDFKVLIHDGDNYVVEINELRRATGEPLLVDDGEPAALTPLSGGQELYEANVQRKCAARLAAKKHSPQFTQKVARLQQKTLEEFLATDAMLKKIEMASPPVFQKLIRLVNEFENRVVGASDTWEGTAEELTTKLRDELEARIVTAMSPDIDHTRASSIARHMVARWLAICELDYE